MRDSCLLVIHFNRFNGFPVFLFETEIIGKKLSVGQINRYWSRLKYTHIYLYALIVNYEQISNI